GEGQVVLNRTLEGEPFAFAVLTQESEPLADPPPRRALVAGDAFDTDLSRSNGVKAEDRPEQLGASGTDQPGDAEDLAATDREIDLPGQRPSRQPLEFEDGLARGMGNRWKELREVAADHLGDDRAEFSTFQRARGHGLAIAQNCVATCDSANLFEEV